LKAQVDGADCLILEDRGGELRARALQAGAVAPKPFAGDDLLDAVARALAN